ncbi:hypothetical protein BN3660_01021 [Eubacteriaceae bacterium CHKCI004]|nr:hypothetical protein BN3660_01021 [Eubacteriaceae bacterium CHKCI004]
MAKSKIIKEFANNEISLEVALNRLIIIASDIENDELAQWAENELNGYHEASKLPVYRIIENTRFLYSGINGNLNVTNAPLQLTEIIGADKLDDKFYIFDGVESLISFVNSQNKYEYAKDLTAYAGIVRAKTGVLCTLIKQVIPINEIVNIISTIKSKLLKVLIALDKEYGCLDKLDIDITHKDPKKVRKINSIIINYIYEDRSIKIGDKNRIDSTDIQSGEKHG